MLLLVTLGLLSLVDGARGGGRSTEEKATWEDQREEPVRSYAYGLFSAERFENLIALRSRQVDVHLGNGRF